jgi:hypothetical protein
MKKTVIISCILWGVISIIACGQYPKNTFPGWESAVEEFREPAWRLNYYYSNKFFRDRYINFFTLNKDIYFKSEQEYKRFRALSYFIEGDPIACLQMLREYVVETGDYLTPRLEMRAILIRNYITFEFYLSDETERYIITKKIKLSEYQSGLIIWGEGSGAFTALGFMPELYYDQLTFTKDVSGWNKSDRQYDLETLKDIFEYGDRIIPYYYPQKYEIVISELKSPEYSQWLLTQKKERPELSMVIDNSFYLYYMMIGEFEKAYQTGAVYDFEKNWKFTGMFSETAGFSWGVPYIFYVTGRLNEFIPFYASINSDARLKTDDRIYGNASMEFWLSAAHGEKQEFEAAFEYLKTALEKARLFEPHFETEETFPWEQKYSNLLAILWFCYMSNAMDSFREAGRFDEVEAMLRKRVSDFRNLEWIP